MTSPDGRKAWGADSTLGGWVVGTMARGREIRPVAAFLRLGVRTYTHKRPRAHRGVFRSLTAYTENGHGFTPRRSQKTLERAGVLPQRRGDGGAVDFGSGAALCRRPDEKELLEN